MLKDFHYTVNLLIQGTEVNTLCFMAESQAEADQIVFAAVKEGTLSSLIGNCQSSETNLDYDFIKFLTPEQADGQTTVTVFRDKLCIYSNQPEQRMETLEELLLPALDYLNNEYSCITCEELREQADIAINQLTKALKRVKL